MKVTPLFGKIMHGYALRDSGQCFLCKMHQVAFQRDLTEMFYGCDLHTLHGPLRDAAFPGAGGPRGDRGRPSCRAALAREAAGNGRRREALRETLGEVPLFRFLSQATRILNFFHLWSFHYHSNFIFH